MDTTGIPGPELARRKMEFTAFCTCCGQSLAVEAETQEEANYIATLQCSCEGARREQKRHDIKEKIGAICLEPSEHSGFDKVDEDQYKLLIILADNVFEGRIDKVTVGLPDSTVRITKGKDGVLVFNRSHKVEQEVYV